MLTIKILGSGCANCRRLEQLAKKAVDQLAVQAQVVKITDPTQYVDYGVLSTPGLVIDDTTVSSGRLPSLAEITAYITTALSES